MAERLDGFNSYGLMWREFQESATADQIARAVINADDTTKDRDSFQWLEVAVSTLKSILDEEHDK